MDSECQINFAVRYVKCILKLRSAVALEIGRRLTEDLHAKEPHRVLLDESPALGRLDFFESALALMAGYGLDLPPGISPGLM